MFESENKITVNPIVCVFVNKMVIAYKSKAEVEFDTG